MTTPSETIDFKHIREEKNTPSTFAEDLFPYNKVWNSYELSQVENVRDTQVAPVIEKEDRKESVSAEKPLVSEPVENNEKKNILSSFEKFVSENGDENNEGREVSFPGGKVVSKDIAGDKVFDLEKLKSSTGDNVVFFDDYDKDKIKVVFICEKPKDMREDNQGQDLLSKMIAAMNMPKEEYLRVFIAKDDEPQENCSFVMKELLTNKPLTVVTMGAFATNSFTRKKDRLSKIHGKLSEFHFVSGGLSTSVSHFPVFHPDLLTINPNMKRSAWIDLQKVMKHVGYL